MNSPLIGILGILLGIFMTEYFNRRKRVEIYAQKVFERRLDVYETLFKLLRIADEAASGTFDETSLSEDDRHAIISTAVIGVAEYCDAHGLYIDGHVGASLTATFIGTEDIAGMADPQQKREAIFEYRQNLKEARKMVMEESGISAINRHFKLISKSKPSSPIISRIKELEKQQTKHRRTSD